MLLPGILKTSLGILESILSLRYVKNKANRNDQLTSSTLLIALRSSSCSFSCFASASVRRDLEALKVDLDVFSSRFNFSSSLRASGTSEIATVLLNDRLSAILR